VYQSGRTARLAAGIRRGVAGFLPIGILVVILLTLLGSGAPMHRPDSAVLARRLHDVGPQEIVLILFSVAVLLAILPPFHVSLVRLLEGYWGGSLFASALSDLGLAIQRKRLERLKKAFYDDGDTPRVERRSALAAVKLQAYPREANLLPTQLGNALRAAEDRAGQRYGLDTIAAWPRLYPCLSPPLADVLNALRDRLDLAARMAAALLLATVASAAILVRHGWWLLLPLITVMLSWIAYRAAIRAAVAYGLEIDVAFDLHRFDMLQSLHLPLPDNPESELRFNGRLTDFLQGGASAVELGIPAYCHGDSQSFQLGTVPMARD
jgi:uncharacterized membrane protein YhaH (DUF805 family)